MRWRFRMAMESARGHVDVSLHRMMRKHGILFDQETALADCPWCHGKASLLLEKPEGGVWEFSCSFLKCPAHGKGRDVDFLALTLGFTKFKAARYLLDMAGEPDPFSQAEKERADKRVENPERETSADPMTGLSEEEPTLLDLPPSSPPTAGRPFSEPKAPATMAGPPCFIRIPDIGRNVYERAWSLLGLTPKGAESLRVKRGMPDEWIEAFGFKSAIPSNQDLLSPILNEFPPNVLLQSGIAQRGKDHVIRIDSAICGRQFNENSGRWESVDNLIIPYVDARGRIVMLRPHKRSLSNSRWREREAIAELYEKGNNNLRIIYGEAFLMDRDERWANTCVICEGEFKATALRMCGIPAIGFQGIHYFLQNKHTWQAVEDTTRMLQLHGIREVIVVFDNEDKGHKEFHERFDSKIYARFTAEKMESKGFKSLVGFLPDSWKEGGEKDPATGRMIKMKADWDSRLAYHVRKCHSHPAGLIKAKEEFERFLHERKGNAKVGVRPVQRQVDWLDEEEDCINQALHRLRHEPKIFVGGTYEMENASEMANFCHAKYKGKLKVELVCSKLRDTYGGYYKIKPPSDVMEAAARKALEEIKQEIEKLQDEPDRSAEQEFELKRLRAAKKCAITILYKLPERFTDFTSVSKYKVQAVNQDGSTRLDRLIVFQDKNGVKSRPFQLSPAMMGSSQELRKFFLSMGNYHWSGGQNECDMWVEELDVTNYQKTIEQIETYGWQKESKLYLLGDCAVADGGRFIFPDRNGIIWYQGRGYKNSDTMENFTSLPPYLFQENEKNPAEAFKALDWEKEREEVEAIWTDLLTDFHESMDEFSGYALVAGTIQYLAHAEVFSEIGGKPGLMIQGEKGSGKTKTQGFAMRIVGFPEDYGLISLGSTRVGVERTLTQFYNLPVHIDEWRNENVDSKLEDLIRNSHNEVAIAKGTPNGNKGIRKMIPLTIPIITGEDNTNDTAMRSRYFQLVASKNHNHFISPDETQEDMETRVRTEQQRRDARFYRMMERSSNYYRVGRYLFYKRREFAKSVVELAKDFAANSTVQERIPDSRARQVFGVVWAALSSAQNILCAREDAFGKKLNTEIFNWFVNNGSESSGDTERDVFRKRFFAQCLTMRDSGVQDVDKYIRVWPGIYNEQGSISLCKAVNDSPKLFALIAANELFGAYELDQSKKHRSLPISLGNIRNELRRQPAWVSPNNKTRCHRFTMPDEKGLKRQWWVLDYKLLEPDMKEIFHAIYDHELNRFGMAWDGNHVFHGESNEVLSF